MSRLVYREVQRFRQVRLWLILLIVCGVVIATLGFGLIQQLVRGEPWGDRPLSDVGLSLSFLISIGLAMALAWLFWRLTLVVEVRDDALHVHFRPLRRRTVQYGEIGRVEACRYRPIIEYGGWGIRRGLGGWAYNVSGSSGVRIHFADGHHLLIGSQQAERLAAAIEKARQHR